MTQQFAECIFVQTEQFGSLADKMFKGSFYCFDMFMTLSPIYFLCIVGQLIYAAGLILSFFTGATDFLGILKDIGLILGSGYGMFFMLGLFTTVSEWKKIRAGAGWKILTTLAFPISMILFLPITVVALFAKPQWKHITHDSNVTKDDIVKQ